MITTQSRMWAQAPTTVAPFDYPIDVPEPPQATGQYPDPVWARHADQVTEQGLAALGNEDEAPEPPRATGQYPDPIWPDNSAISQDRWVGTTKAEPADSPEPPPTTGQYPDPVWHNEQMSAPPQSLAAPTAPVADPANKLLAFKALDYTNEIGTTPDSAQIDAPTQDEVLLDYQEIYQIIRAVAVADSGEEIYTAVSADPPIDQKRHFGLAFGFVLFTQESGLLGALLRIMQRRDGGLFAETFGEQAVALLATTNAATAQERLQPVGDRPLWGMAWLERFKQAGTAPAFQAAQNEAAIEYQFRPMLNVAHALGFQSDRGLAMVYDCVVTRGLGGLRWVVQAAGPLRTATQRDNALRILGYSQLAAFQAAIGWTPQDGQFGPETHAALVGELRRQGAIPLPTDQELQQRLVSRAEGTAKSRLLRLRDLRQFDDIRYRQS